MQIDKYSQVWYHWKGKALESLFVPHVVLAIMNITMATAPLATMCAYPCAHKWDYVRKGAKFRYLKVGVSPKPLGVGNSTLTQVLLGTPSIYVGA